MYSISSKLKFIESVFGSGKLAANGKNFGVRCPICAPKDASKRKLVIRVDDDLAHCWTCAWKGHNLAGLIRRFGSPRQLAEYRDEFLPDGHRISAVEPDGEERPKLELPKDFRMLVHCAQSTPGLGQVWTYLRSRGVTQRDAWYYKLGISSEHRWRGRVIMPSFDADGELNYFVGRSVYELDRRQKYDNPEDDKLPIIFNEINLDWKKRLVVCEGPFDLMKCGDNAVPLLGSDLNEHSKLFSQVALHGTPIALALDGDMWQKKTPYLARKLQEYDVDVVVVDVRSHGDPGAMTKAQFREVLAAATAPTWSSNFLNRLDRASEVRMRVKSDTYGRGHY